jgi:tRNA 2-selenouridine synthase
MNDHVQSYAVTIDARSPREFADDHVPGAINLPVLNDVEYAEIGTLHRSSTSEAYKKGVAYALRNIADALDGRPEVFQKGAAAPFLVYCFRGGKRSRLWVDALATCGIKADRMEGGWKRYRREVIDGIARVGPTLKFNVLSGMTGTGKTRLLHGLEAVGEQMIDLEGLANHRGSLIGYMAGTEQPSQKYFESLLWNKLASFDPSRPVWVEAESAKVGNCAVPKELLAAIHTGAVVRVSADMDVRLAVWQADFGHFSQYPDELLRLLSPLVPLVGHDVFRKWQGYADAKDMQGWYRSLMEDHYDPCYERSLKRNYGDHRDGPAVTLEGITDDAIHSTVGRLRALTL